MTPPAEFTAAAPPTHCDADYFDGVQAKARSVRVHLAQGQLHIEGDGVSLQVPARQVSWPERQRHGVRQAYLRPQGLLVARDAAQWDRWARANGRGDSWLVGWMQSWHKVVLAFGLLIGVLAALYVWGTPLAARGVLAVCPTAVDEQVGTLVLEQIESRLLKPTTLPEARQAELRQRFAQSVARSYRDRPAPAWTLHFRAAADKTLGPNAFALPGGHIVLTDEMTRLLADRPEVLMGVLGHELGHVEHRHGMRMVIQVGLLSVLATAVVGDFSTVLTAAPVILGQMAYSRDFEHEADRAAARMMRANGVDPGEFAVLFERLQAASKAGQPAGAGLPIALSTHPPDAERVRRMREMR